MDQIQVKLYEPKNGEKIKIIQITDVMLHTNDMRPTKSPGKKIEESFTFNTPGRIYEPLPSSPVSDARLLAIETLASDPSFKEMVKRYQEQGYKVLMGFTKGGIPTLLGKDAVEFANSIKGQRIQRRLEKDKPVL